MQSKQRVQIWVQDAAPTTGMQDYQIQGKRNLQVSLSYSTAYKI
jgi:hypothetical protein